MPLPGLLVGDVTVIEEPTDLALQRAVKSPKGTTPLQITEPARDR